MSAPLNEAKAAAARLREYRDGLPKVQESALRSAGWKVVLEAQTDFASVGVGRRIWGEGRNVVQKRANTKSGFRKVNVLNKLMYLEKSKFRNQRQGTLDAWFRVKGLPAVVLTGGKFRSHEIAPRTAKAIRFTGPGGEAFAMSVKHPGASFRKWALISEKARKLTTYYPPAFAKKDLAFRRKIRLV